MINYIYYSYIKNIFSLQDPYTNKPTIASESIFSISNGNSFPLIGISQINNRICLHTNIITDLDENQFQCEPPIDETPTTPTPTPTPTTCCPGIENCSVTYRVTYFDGSSVVRTASKANYWQDDDFIEIGAYPCGKLTFVWLQEVNCLNAEDPESGSGVYSWVTYSEYDLECEECCERTYTIPGFPVPITERGGRNCVATLVNQESVSNIENYPGCIEDPNFVPYVSSIELLSLDCDPNALPCESQSFTPTPTPTSTTVTTPTSTPALTPTPTLIPGNQIVVEGNGEASSIPSGSVELLCSEEQIIDIYFSSPASTGEEYALILYVNFVEVYNSGFTSAPIFTSICKPEDGVVSYEINRNPSFIGANWSYRVEFNCTGESC